MNHLKKIGIMLLVLGVISGFTQALLMNPNQTQTLRLSGGSFRTRIVSAGVRDAHLQGQKLFRLR